METKYYTIARIDEADFGCEGRLKGQPAMDKIWLRDETGTEQIVWEEDEFLYERNLNEGDEVIFDKEGKLQKKM